jgi:hypothetical protein
MYVEIRLGAAGHGCASGTARSVVPPCSLRVSGETVTTLLSPFAGKGCADQRGAFLIRVSHCLIGSQADLFLLLVF